MGIGVGIALILGFITDRYKKRKRQQQAEGESPNPTQEGDSPPQDEENSSTQDGESPAAPTVPEIKKESPLDMELGESVVTCARNASANPDNTFPPQYVGYNPTQENTNISIGCSQPSGIETVFFIINKVGKKLMLTKQN